MRITNVAIWVLAIAIAGFGAGCGDDGGGTADAAAQLSCASYCGAITTNCTGANSQYGAMGQCMSTCAHFPIGAAADTAGNTLGCRTYHAGAAQAGPDVHCRHAGPGGDAACGANCEGFCTLVMGSCTGANMQFGGDMGTCMAACNGFVTTPLYNSMETGGDTFACRLYHATVASGDPVGHCGHTAATSMTCN